MIPFANVSSAFCALESFNGKENLDDLEHEEPQPDIVKSKEGDGDIVDAAPPSQVWYPYHTIAGSPRIRLGTTFPFVPNALRSCTAYGAPVL